MCEGHGGRLWLGSWGGGVFSLDRRTHIVSSAYTSNSLMTNTVFEDTQGLVWSGMWDSGVICYDPAKRTTTWYVSEWGKPAVLSANHIMAVHEDASGTLWLGANNGLNRFDRSTCTFTYMMDREALGGNGVLSILHDNHGNLWMATTAGITKFDPRTGRFKHYDVPGEVEQGCRAMNGEMFFGSSRGLIRFHPDSIRENSYVPPIVITGFRKFDQSFPFGKEIRLPYADNSLAFEFAALSYVSPEKNQYAYTMEGLDRDWVYFGTRRYASYPHLEPGEYVFRVKGSNNDGVWNEEGTSIAVIITPPWWRRWWFTVFFWVTIVGAIGGSIRYVEMKKLKRTIERLEQERALERERARISQDLHDDIGASLSRIALFSEAAKEEASGASPRLLELSEKIGNNARELLDAVGALVWSMDPRHEKFEDGATHMKNFAQEMFALKNIDFSFIMDPDVSHLSLPIDARKNILLIFKEAVNNIIKHAHCKTVRIEMRTREDTFIMTIEDDGRGPIQRGAGKGHGLENMKTRARNVGAELAVDSIPEGGTRVRLSLPVARKE
jgi:signal transduction histidine kinase